MNVHTNSRYIFLILHSCGSVWKERGLLTSNRQEIKHAAEILKLLGAVQVPLQVAVRHCPGHQKEDSKVAGGSNVAERAAKEAAKGMFIMPSVPVLDLSQFDLEYSNADLEKAKG